MPDGRSYIQRRFGSVVAKWYVRAWIAATLTMLLILGLLGILLPAEGSSLAYWRWIGVALSCLGMSILWRMYQSGTADDSNDFAP